MSEPEVGTTRWRVFKGGLSGRYYTARMRWDGYRWEAIAVKHDVTEDVLSIILEDKSE